MSILHFLSSGNYITVNKKVIEKLGLEEAIILGELASEYEYWLKDNRLEDGYFFSTIENVEKNTTLSEYKQRKAINKLQELGMLEIKVKGMPAKRYIKINEVAVLEMFNLQLLKNSGTTSEKIKEQLPEKLNGNKNNIKNKEEEDINNKETLYSLIERNFGRMLSPLEYEEISKWEDNEITRYAIKEAVLRRALNVKYIMAIIADYEAKGIKTIKEIRRQKTFENDEVLFDYDWLKEEE